MKQSYIVDSTTKVKYVVATKAFKEVVWLHKFLQDFEVVHIENAPMKVNCDNSGVVAQSKGPRKHKKQKHIQGSITS